MNRVYVKEKLLFNDYRPRHTPDPTNRRDKSPRQVAATNRVVHVTCQNPSTLRMTMFVPLNPELQGPYLLEPKEEALMPYRKVIEGKMQGSQKDLRSKT